MHMQTCSKPYAMSGAITFTCCTRENAGSQRFRIRYSICSRPSKKSYKTYFDHHSVQHIVICQRINIISETLWIKIYWCWVLYSKLVCNLNKYWSKLVKYNNAPALHTEAFNTAAACWYPQTQYPSHINLIFPSGLDHRTIFSHLP
jgi:hypothetical protein